MYEYLSDMNFLQLLDKLHIRTHYAKIILLSFDKEEFLGEILGNITSGSLSVNGSSAIRRTINLTMVTNSLYSNIEDIDNKISAKTKIRVEVGYNNPIKDSKYEDVIWFPCGTFVVSTANVSRSTSGWNISITGKDKMCLLDGTVGGVLPVSITFHEKQIKLSNGDIEIQYPTIFLIIYEAVNHWGGELFENIIISDVDDTAKLLVKYMGDKPIYFDTEYRGFSYQKSEDFPMECKLGEDAGYKETDFTWPGELVLNAGDTVVTLLDKVKSTLGNYEYYYDINGRFVFLQIKNYLNTGSPLMELKTEDYVKSYNNAKYLYSLTDLDTTTAINRSPKYDLLKNDFYVWGVRKQDSDVEVNIRYHLVIDNKPTVFEWANAYMWELRGRVEEDLTLLIGYTTTNDATPPLVDNADIVTLIGPPSTEWREELYRRALVAQVSNLEENVYYNSELLVEWRGLYDPNKESWKDTLGWNPAVHDDPASLNYWLDFIDDGSEVSKYSIGLIGRRTKVVNDSNIKAIYYKEVPDIIFLENDLDRIKYYQTMGLRYFVLNELTYDLFLTSSTGTSCFDKIREMLYLNLNYNTSISITCLPKYYMEPNNIIYINDKDSGINGNYLITQFTLPLAYNGTMSITATEVLTRV